MVKVAEPRLREGQRLAGRFSHGRTSSFEVPLPFL